MVARITNHNRKFEGRAHVDTYKSRETHYERAPFEVGLIVRITTYNKEHPHE